MTKMIASPALSPCTGICTIAAHDDRLAGHCIGCGRSLDEIGLWRDLSDDSRRRIMAALPGRLSSASMPVTDKSARRAVP
ncbi:DUF1289 domain-containing protein [Neorhizobium sp. NPDC001467]|uniref:DUF1289 domain-containing protein n=1 Tax=Neorhizobium sp. NPDC001467 TaxID=3390595 RepID=UPI003D03CAD2